MQLTRHKCVSAAGYHQARPCNSLSAQPGQLGQPGPARLQCGQDNLARDSPRRRQQDALDSKSCCKTCGHPAESASLLHVNSVREPRRARREARGADFGDSARRGPRVRASARLGQPCRCPRSMIHILIYVRKKWESPRNLATL